MIMKPAVVPVVGAVRETVLFAVTTMRYSAMACEEFVQVEQVNTSVEPAPLSVSVPFFTLSIPLMP